MAWSGQHRCGSTLLMIQTILLVTLVAQSAATTRPTDVSTLQGLLRVWQGGYSGVVLKNWSFDKDADPCHSHWQGVFCSEDSVSILDLSGAGLSGGIPADIGNLNDLIILDLSRNPMLRGSIPEQIGNLDRLVKLNLSGCHLSGVVPHALSTLDKLQNLDLSHNIRLTFPQETQELTKLSSSRLEKQKIFDLVSLRHHHHHRTLMQATPAPPPHTVASPPKVVTKTPPPPSQATIVRKDLMYAGIALCVFVVLMFGLCCWCRYRTSKRSAQGRGKLPGLPRFGYSTG